ncbi:hypothetical protein [Stakelama tenebrarum]|uniref:Uncharacterized protein n=1 Tax=Stakelama tenebrarum TaxID=2711215 RepID=A0A6G6Y4E1_9SPHN|nr:hypothetical protein [Sphingosinithalassobacter tenebrarum]QIG79473.1 hypothetical protein G5C33_06505 [Sphingosinithalassobacter tenebrarum]
MKPIAFIVAATVALAGLAPTDAEAQETLKIEFVSDFSNYPGSAHTKSACLDANHQNFVNSGGIEVNRTDNGRWYSVDDDYGKGKFLMYCSNQPGVIGLGVRFSGNPTRYPNINFDTRGHSGQSDCMRRARSVASGSIYSLMEAHDNAITLINRSSNIAVTIVCTGFGEVMFAGWGRGRLIDERETVEQLWRMQ